MASQPEERAAVCLGVPAGEHCFCSARLFKQTGSRILESSWKPQKGDRLMLTEIIRLARPCKGPRTLIMIELVALDLHAFRLLLCAPVARGLRSAVWPAGLCMAFGQNRENPKIEINGGNGGARGRARRARPLYLAKIHLARPPVQLRPPRHGCRPVDMAMRSLAVQLRASHLAIEWAPFGTSSRLHHAPS